MGEQCCEYAKKNIATVIWTAAHQAPLSMGFSRQEYSCGFPCLSSRGSSQPRDQTRLSYISCSGRWILYHWGTWEAQLDLTNTTNSLWYLDQVSSGETSPENYHSSRVMGKSFFNKHLLWKGSLFNYHNGKTLKERLVKRWDSSVKTRAW